MCTPLALFYAKNTCTSLKLKSNLNNFFVKMYWYVPVAPKVFKSFAQLITKEKKSVNCGSLSMYFFKIKNYSYYGLIVFIRVQHISNFVLKSELSKQLIRVRYNILIYLLVIKISIKSKILIICTLQETLS